MNIKWAVKKINIFPFLKRICRAFVWMKMECIYRENARCTFVQMVLSERSSDKWLQRFCLHRRRDGGLMASPRLGAFFSMLREYSVTTEPRKVSL